MVAPSQSFWGPKLLSEARECLAGQGWLPEAQHQCPVPLPAFAGCEVQVSHLFKEARGAQIQPVPACPALCLGTGLPFYGWFSQRGALAKFARRSV